MTDLGICDRCGERPAIHFRAVGSDPNKFTWGKFERWCIECEEEVQARVDARLAEARRRHHIDLYGCEPPKCELCGGVLNHGHHGTLYPLDCSYVNESEAD